MCEQAGYLKRESYVVSFHVLESVSWKGYKLVYAKGTTTNTTVAAT